MLPRRILGEENQAEISLWVGSLKQITDGRALSRSILHENIRHWKAHPANARRVITSTEALSAYLSRLSCDFDRNGSVADTNPQFSMSFKATNALRQNENCLASSFCWLSPQTSTRQWRESALHRAHLSINNLCYVVAKECVILDRAGRHLSKIC